MVTYQRITHFITKVLFYVQTIHEDELDQKNPTQTQMRMLLEGKQNGRSTMAGFKMAAPRWLPWTFKRKCEFVVEEWDPNTKWWTQDSVMYFMRKLHCNFLLHKSTEDRSSFLGVGDGCNGVILLWTSLFWEEDQISFCLRFIFLWAGGGGQEKSFRGGNTDNWNEYSLLRLVTPSAATLRSHVENVGNACQIHEHAK